MNNFIFLYGFVTGVAASFVFVFIGVCLTVRSGIKKEENQNETG